MASVVVCVETDEVRVKRAEENFSSNWENTNDRKTRVSIDVMYYCNPRR